MQACSSTASDSAEMTRQRNSVDVVSGDDVDVGADGVVVVAAAAVAVLLANRLVADGGTMASAVWRCFGQ